VAPIGTGPDYQTDVRNAQQLAFLMEEGHASGLIEAAIRFAWSKRELSTVLVGVSSLEHLEDALDAAARGGLSTAALGRLPQAWSSFKS
jgi:predicted aldo/keto reductase-like oxidoreductase